MPDWPIEALDEHASWLDQEIETEALSPPEPEMVEHYLERLPFGASL
jgi:hypothetical protein